MEQKREPQQKTEGIVLGLYGVYSIGIIVNISNSNLEKSSIWLIVAGWILSAALYIKKVRSYRFRTYFTTLMLMSSVLIYGVIVPDLLSNMATIVTVIIILGLYGDLNIITLTILPVTLLVLYHIRFAQDITATSAGDWSLMLQQICSAYLALYIVYCLVKKQLEVNDRQLEIIEELRAAERSKDDFLANVSHEIRTPVNTICGMSEIVLRESLAPEIRENVHSIQEAGRNLISVVSDILDFSELQTGKMQLEEVEYNIASTLNDVINMSMTKKTGKKIELMVDCSALLPSRLMGDEQKIRRVIMNLVDNAVKFTGDGCISIRVSCRETKQGANLMVQVSDTGIGIKEENLEKMFTSFSQVDTKRNRQEGGLGLGLAISQELVERMGGFISIKSTFGKGTRVKFVIPQRVIDPTPIVSLENPEEFQIAIYVDSEQIEVRENYVKSIEQMAQELEVDTRIFRNLSELKKSQEKTQFTHMFLSMESYQTNREYFDELSETMAVVVLLDRAENDKIQNSRILRIYKPFSVLAVAAILNEEQIEEEYYYSKQNRFIAPQVHVLVVDDNLMNIRVFEGLLEPYQIQVTRASSGFEALKKIESMDYDLVFMDHMMPDMDGVETLQRIRNKRGSYYKSVPVIALTANAIAGMRGMFLEKGFQDFIAKPVELSVLERVLERNIPPNKRQNVSEEDRIAHKAKENVTEPKMLAAETETVDVDVKKGISYCGNKKNYLEVLQLHCEEAEGNREKLQTYFEESDLNNYTILVHALKSSMKSIGVNGLSGMAKELEAAGKRADMEYIRAHHKELMDEYARIIALLEEKFLRDQEKKEEKKQDEKMAEALSEEAFDAYMEALENAMYELQKEEMLDILTKMQQYSYHGHDLSKPLVQIKKKVEMLDLMSAVEVLSRLRERLQRQQ